MRWICLPDRALQSESVGVVHAALGGACDVGGEALVALVERALGGGVFAPGLPACGAAPVVALKQPPDDVGQQLAIGDQRIMGPSGQEIRPLRRVEIVNDHATPQNAALVRIGVSPSAT